MGARRKPADRKDAGSPHWQFQGAVVGCLRPTRIRRVYDPVERLTSIKPTLQRIRAMPLIAKILGMDRSLRRS